MENSDILPVPRVKKTKSVGENLGYFELIKLIWEIRNGMAACLKGGETDAARKISKSRSRRFHETLRSAGIDVHLPDIEPGEIEELPAVFGNHQAGSIEALSAYALLPPNFRIALKNSLLRLPFSAGKGVKRLDPIVAPRSKKGKLDKVGLASFRQEVQKTIENGESVLIFPEGTRSKDGKLNHLQRPLMRTAIKSIQTLPSGKRNIGILTTDSIEAFPFKPEQAWNPFKKAKRQPVHFYFNTLNVDGMDTSDVRKKVTDIMRGHLES